MKTVFCFNIVKLFSNLLVMSESSYTELQKDEIHELSERIKEIHRPHLSRIEPITNNLRYFVFFGSEYTIGNLLANM